MLYALETMQVIFKLYIQYILYLWMTLSPFVKHTYDPHCPWFLMGVTFPFWRQSKLFGKFSGDVGLSALAMGTSAGWDGRAISRAGIRNIELYSLSL